MMAQAAPKLMEALPPVTGPAIDRDHLARLTFGDLALERELLALFDQQAAVLLARMQAADVASVAALAHTLKGSALGVGAFDVARAAAVAEQARDAVLAPAIGHLAVAIEAARAHIAALLRAASADTDGAEKR